MKSPCISWNKIRSGKAQGISRAQFLKIIIIEIHNAGKEGKI